MTERLHFHFQRRSNEDLAWRSCKSTIIHCTSLGIPANHAQRGVGCETERMVLAEIPVRKLPKKPSCSVVESLHSV